MFYHGPSEIDLIAKRSDAPASRSKRTRGSRLQRPTFVTSVNESIGEEQPAQ